MLLSIIIPVYQTEQTLRRCLDSVVSQSFRDWQAILVDDASTDGSRAICDEYGKRDPRIRVIGHKANLGLSEARNTGIKRAAGQYITFMDSDDWLAPDTLHDVMGELAVHPDYDILEYPAYVHYGGPRQRLLRLPKREYTDMAAYWLRGGAYDHTYAWNKVYRSSLFGSVRFPAGKNFEDVWTLPKLLANCRIVATTSAGLYYYYDNPRGITRRASQGDLASLLDAHLRVLRHLHPTPAQRGFDKRLARYFAAYYASVLNICLDLADTSPSGSLPRLCAQFPVLPYRNTLKLRLLHILGIKNLCRIHRIFRHNRSSRSS